MSLLSLPNELLIYVSRYLDYADDTSALSRTCHLLYLLINPLLFPRFAKQHHRDAILYAIGHGDHVLMEKLLIQTGVDLFSYVESTHHSPLPIAARKGHLGMVQVLLDLTGESIHLDSLNDDAPLVETLLGGHLEIAQLLISRGAIPDFRTSYDKDRTALSLVAEQGPLASVQFLIEETLSDMESKDSKGYTPLLHAASHGSLDVLKYLVKMGANPTVTDNQGKTALFHAAEQDRMDICLFLLDTSWSDYLLNNFDGMSLAHVASKGRKTANLLLNRMDSNTKIASAAGHELVLFLFSSAACGLDPFVQRLLEKGCDPLAQVLLEKEPSIDGEMCFHKYDSPLRQAAANDHVNVVRLLLDSIHARDQLGPSIMDIIPIAAENNAFRVLQDILDSNMRDITKTCISDALQLTAPYEEATQLLLKHGASPDKDGDGGYQLLQQVVEQGSCSSVKMLLEVMGLDPVKLLAVTPHGCTSLLETATTFIDLKMVKLLLEKVDFHPANEEYQQALSSAISWGRVGNHVFKSVEIIEYFLDHGFDVNTRAKRGAYAGSPLLTISVSTAAQQDVVVSLLLSRGADVHATDESQQTALWWAVNRGDDIAVPILLDHGADPLHENINGRTPLDECVSGYNYTLLRIILRAMEARGVQYDLTDLMHKAEERRRRYHKHEENKLLKYLIQHRCRVMYPCASDI